MKRMMFIAFLLISLFVPAASAVAATDMPIESDSMGITVRPTLLLAGSFEGMPEVFMECGGTFVSQGKVE